MNESVRRRMSLKTLSPFGVFRLRDERIGRGIRHQIRWASGLPEGLLVGDFVGREQQLLRHQEEERHDSECNET